MKKILTYLPLFVVMLALLASCKEVSEASKYDNWKERNQAFIDSLQTVVGERIVTKAEQADAMEQGELYAIMAPSTTTSTQFIYCRKLVANTTGERPNYTGYHSTVDAYYYGTLINGEKFDGYFTGFSALDRSFTPEQVEARKPTEFDVTQEFTVRGVIEGWTLALQYMREGERWLIYIPYQSAYGTSGSGSILGYSALTFDMILEKVK